MTAVAARLLNDFEMLAPEEQLLVRERVIAMTERIQREVLERLHRGSAGKQLLAKLLIERAGERAHG